MKTNKTLMSIAILSLALSACATAPAPTAAVPTPASAPLYTAPAVAAATIPEWFITQPDSTPEVVYVAGSAVSRDISMSGHKAQLDAETHLAYKIAGAINALTKDYKREVGDEFVQNTEIVANKVAVDVKVIGGTVVKRQVTAEGGGFRTYVLIKFPLGTNNQMLQNYLNKKSFKGSKEAAERDLSKAQAADKQEENAPAAEVRPVTLGNSEIVIRETLATSNSKPLGIADRAEEN